MCYIILSSFVLFYYFFLSFLNYSISISYDKMLLQDNNLRFYYAVLNTWNLYVITLKTCCIPTVSCSYVLCFRVWFGINKCICGCVSRQTSYTLLSYVSSWKKNQEDNCGPSQVWFVLGYDFKIVEEVTLIFSNNYASINTIGMSSHHTVKVQVQHWICFSGK